MTHEFTPRDYGLVDWFRVGAVGVPGKRTFYLMIEMGGDPVWFKCEKEQAAALAQQSIEILGAMERTVDEGAVEGMVSTAGEMTGPSEHDHFFPVESIAMRISSDHFFQILLRGSEEGQEVLFMTTPEQLRAMAIMALESVNAGRPLCPMCLLPENPDGHDCPSGNGHRPAR